MAKSRRPRRPRREPPFDPVDDKRVRSGEIPWSLDDLGAAFERAAALHNTPHDDWERKEVGVSIADEGGSVSRLVFNPDIMLNQIMQWLMVRFQKQGLSRETKMSHAWRFMEIQALLADHDAVLRREGLVKDDPTEPDCASISSALMEVLATARYEGVRLQGPEREPVPAFHLDRVIAEAKKRDSDGGGERYGRGRGAV
jgi:hypothetical protein